MNNELDISNVIEILTKSSILKGSSPNLFKDMNQYIGGSKGGKKTVHKPIEEPDNLFSQSCISITDLICEGPIEGVFVPSGAYNWDGNDQLLRSTYLDSTPVINDDNTVNYFSYSSFLSNGSQDSSQGIIARVVDIQKQLKYSLQTSVPQGGGSNSRALLAGVNYSILSPYVSEIIIGLRVPSLYSINKSNGDTDGSSISFAVFVDGVNIFQGSIAGKTTTGYVRQYVIQLPPASQAVEATLAPRIITIQKTNPDSISAADIQTVFVDYIVEIGTDALIYPNSVIARSKFSSLYFSTLPNRQYDLKGLLVAVPDNYTPDPFFGLSPSQIADIISANPTDFAVNGYGGKYDGDWNGTFSAAQWSNNPAWCLYDLLTNTRYGLGNYIDSSHIDKWALYQIAQYCDQLVPIIYADGTIGTEPRFTCNVKIDTREDAFKIILQFTSLFRGLCFWDGNTLSFSQDSPKDAIMQFNNSNITSDGFSYTDVDKNSIYSVALVGYYDQNDFFQKKVVYVQNPEGVRQYGIREIEIDAFGCTSRTQAYRLGKWALYSSLYEKEIVNFKAGLDILYCKPGDVIQIMDSDRLQDRRGGRLNDITDSYNIVLDQAIYVDPASLASLSIIVPTDVLNNQTSSSQIERPSQIFTANITGVSSAGYYQNITLDSPLTYLDYNIIPESYTWILNTNSIDPAKLYYENNTQYNSFVLNYLNQQSSYLQQIDVNGFTPSLYRILSIKENSDGTYEITALQYNPDKYDLIEENNVVDISIVVPPTNQNINAVGALKAVVSIDNNGVSTITVTWVAPLGFSATTMSYVVSYTYDGSTVTNTTKYPYFVVSGISDPNATVSFTVYPIYDSNPGLTPSPNSIATASVTNTNPNLSTLSITNFEIVGQDTNYENVNPDVDIDWTLNNPQAISLLSNFQLNISTVSGIPLRTENISTSGSSTYDYTFDFNLADGSGVPSRYVNFNLNAISIYGDVSASAFLDTVNSAPPAVYPNSGYSVTGTSEGFRVDYDISTAPDDYNGFLLYYSTVPFDPLTDINVSGYQPLNSNIRLDMISGISTTYVTVGIPAGTSYYGCVVPFDTFGLYNLNLPISIFSGISDYGITSSTPVTPNGFTLTPVIETDMNNHNQCYIQVFWNPNPESNISSYDIRIMSSGLETRYYSSTETQNNLYVDFPPGLNISGVIRAINNQGNYSDFATGYATTPIISNPSILIASGIDLGVGISSLYIPFGPTNDIPKVFGTMVSNTTIIPWTTSDVTISGFNLLLGVPIPNTGYKFNYILI